MIFLSNNYHNYSKEKNPRTTNGFQTFFFFLLVDSETHFQAKSDLQTHCLTQIKSWSWGSDSNLCQAPEVPPPPQSGVRHSSLLTWLNWRVTSPMLSIHRGRNQAQEKSPGREKTGTPSLGCCRQTMWPLLSVLLTVFSIFFHSTYPLPTYDITCIISLCLLSDSAAAPNHPPNHPLLESQLHESMDFFVGGVLFYSLMYPQRLEQCLAGSWYPTHICWVNTFYEDWITD